ncbi:hypothetical protein D8T65_09780 [Vibrio vulnificus]|uniref:heme NO-binding domain-containing protein n=1 Tax=Vibrio vulnificus TaxID=672 RepID=UPI001029F4DD|nr:heme NO-binding domain-containing protein [Vibrio vulnificus]RZQ02504.1 hypothetical protein D8T65_09780 [Vibrio vulnificus]
MKGIIFTEFLELVEEKFGLAVLDDILDRANDQGIYTAVGSYDHRKLVSLIVHLSQVTGLSVEQLQEVFGEAVFDYKSARCMGHVCLGLMRGCAKHFGEELAIQMETLNPTGSHVRFNVALVKGKQDG